MNKIKFMPLINFRFYRKLKVRLGYTSYQRHGEDFSDYIVIKNPSSRILKIVDSLGFVQEDL
jgi:hypothetical protein